MTVSYVASATAEGSGGATVAKPTGTVEGDVMLALVAGGYDSSTSLPGAPSGWVQITNESQTSESFEIATFYKVAGASEGASYAFTAGTGDCMALVATFRDVDVSSPIMASSSAPAVSVASLTLPAVTTTAANAMVVALAAQNTISSWTSPAGMTEAVDVSGSAARNVLAAYVVQAAAGTTGTKTATGFAGATKMGALVALRQANQPPNAPTLVSPTSGTLDIAATNRFSWTFSDPDTGDSQSKFDLRYRPIVATNEIQTVTITGTPTGGTFTLTYSGQTTAAIAYNANAAAVQSALEALSNIAVGDVAVSGGALPGTAVTVTFQGALATTNVAQMTATSSLTGGTTPAVTVATTTQGVPVPAWTDVTHTTTNAYYDMPSGTLTANDYEWQVRTYDAQGLVGPYSASSFFTAATVSNDITITAPTNGATISTASFTVTWSTPTQTHYQLRVVADLAGAPDLTDIIFDTGEIASTTARSREVSYPDNGVTRHTQVRKKQDGLWSDWASVSNPISFTAPAVPTITVDDTSEPGAIQVQASHPAPTGSEPTVSYVDVWRREVDDTGDGIRVATEVPAAGIFTDWFVASGVSYAYRVQAWGDNGTSSFSAWDGGS